MSNRNTWRFATATVAIAAACITSFAQGDETITTGDGLLSLTANMPEEVRVGEEFTYSVQVANTSDNVTIHDIELKQMTAKGFSVASTSVGSADSQSNQAKTQNDSSGKTNSDMKIAMLNPGETKTINVKATADEEGQLKSCLVIVKYMPSICLTSKVIRPELELTKTAPKQASRCNVIELEYMVKNAGSGNVGAFVVTDQLDRGIATIEGDDTLKFEVDGLAAGESRKFMARVFASKPGSFSSRAIAEADNSELKSRSNETTTEVIAAELAVQIEGPNRLYGEQLAKFTAHVTNTGNAVANDVLVNVYWPETCSLVDISQPTMQSSNRSSRLANEQAQREPTMAINAGAATQEADNWNGNQSKSNQSKSDQKADQKADQNNGDQNKGAQNKGDKSNGDQSKGDQNKGDVNSDKIELAMSHQSFTIASLEVGQTAVIEYAVRTGDADQMPTKVVARVICNVDAADDQANAKSESVATAMARADVVRLPATQLVVFDDEDPVATDSNVTYSIRVWNEGDAEDSDVTLKAEIPTGLEFVSAKGPTEHSVDGSTVTFKPIKTMQSGDRADYKVTAKCVGNGDVRFTAILNSKSLKKEVIGEEPTRLFAQKIK